MPELPEVESFARALRKKYVGKVVVKIYFHRLDLRFPFDKKGLNKIFSNGTVLRAIQRFGKQLIFFTDHGAVQIGLGMTGAFLPVVEPGLHDHEHVTLQFADGTFLGFTDPRRFGFWKVIKDFDKIKAEISVNPLDEKELRVLFCSPKVKKSKRNIKFFLLDQSCIAGVGNIYALEALFFSKIHPLQRCDQVTVAQWNALAKFLPKILNTAIKAGGSSIATYRNLNGTQGDFQQHHAVYDRQDQLCVTYGCHQKIKRIAHGGRSSWFCPTCQLF